MKKIGILGSTGSIGTQALNIIENNLDKYEVSFLSCDKNIELFENQIKRFSPKLVVVTFEKDALQLKNKYPNIEVLYGAQGLSLAAGNSNTDLVLNALVGIIGLVPTYSALTNGKDMALANKETLVAGGEIIMKAAVDNKVKIIPVDSEHSAIFQCLEGNRKEQLKKIIITASGGPFRGKNLTDLKNVTIEEALNHPKWSMGNKISIDSATLMNKGLEVIEAKWLFDLLPEQIEVIVHPECIIHSMVEYKDNSILAQLGQADMRIPISYAFEYPKRLENFNQGLDFKSLKRLNFEQVDTNTFKCLSYAYEALRMGKSYSIVLNAANEVLVGLYLNKKISFLEIQNKVEVIMQNHIAVDCKSIDDILEVDKETRERVIKIC
jgi:1-deoxy-D-xylulose-5-phosphate reductoisomerase